MTDEEIVSLYWQRVESAIDHTEEKYESYLLKIASNILYDAEDCKECVNDTYLAAWNSMPENRPKILSTYLGRITRQISIDCYRKITSKKRKASEYTISLSELDDTFSAGDSLEAEEDARLLSEAINSFVRSLSLDSRRVFIGRYYYFDSIKDIASYCGISQANVKTMLYRSRMALKEYLLKEGFVV